MSFPAVPEAHFLALTKHRLITSREGTHWLNLQSVSVAAKESSLGLEEGPGHAIASGGGDLLQPALQRRDLVTERKETQVEGRVEGGWLAKSSRKSLAGGLI